MEAALAQQVPNFGRLPGPDRERVLAMAGEMQRKGLPDSFIFSSVRSTARLLLEVTEEPRPPLPEEAQQLLAQNPSREPQVSARRRPRSEVKAAERDHLLHATRALIREARSAKQLHERKKMRRSLLAIDQGRLRRVLGRDANDLCAQINECLDRSGDLR